MSGGGGGGRLYLDVTVCHFIFEVLEQGNKPTNPGNIGKYSNEIR